MAVAAGLFAALLSSAGPARADDVSTAQARVDALQTEVARVAGQLTEGTRRYEADRARLAQVDRLLANSTRKVAQAQAQADAGTRQVGRIAAQMYRSPQPGLLLLSLSNSQDDIAETFAVQENLQQLAGQQSGEVRAAVAARVRLQGERRVIQQVSAEAASLAKRSGAERGQLVALADATAAKLDAAQNDLAAARKGRDARRAADQAARARASRDRVAVASGPACSGGSTAGQANGNLDPASLCPLWSAPGERLRADAAAAFNAMSQSKATTTGSPLCVSDSYRSYSEQVAVYRSKPGLAAVPGTSAHGWGKAVDFCGGVENPGSAASNWMRANAARFGWSHPSWAEPSGSKPEPWHWEFGD